MTVAQEPVKGKTKHRACTRHCTWIVIPEVESQLTQGRQQKWQVNTGAP